MPARTWTEQQLREAAKCSTNLTELILALGLKVGSNTRIYLRKWLVAYNIDYTHFTSANEHNRSWTEEQLKVAVATSTYLANVLAKLGLADRGSNGETIKKAIMRLGLSTAHWEAFDKAALLEKQRKAGEAHRRPLNELLQNGTEIAAHRLKKRLIDEGLVVDQCVICGQLPVWQGKYLVLPLDHIDGNSKNNLFTNLRVLCLHCHSQTETYAGKNQRRDNNGKASDTNLSNDN